MEKEGEEGIKKKEICKIMAEVCDDLSACTDDSEMKKGFKNKGKIFRHLAEGGEIKMIDIKKNADKIKKINEVITAISMKYGFELFRYSAFKYIQSIKTEKKLKREIKEREQELTELKRKITG